MRRVSRKGHLAAFLEENAFKAGAGVVTANKVPVTSSYNDWQWLTMPRYPPSFRYETTVGAALPVISTLSSLVVSMDTLGHAEAHPNPNPDSNPN